MPLSILVKNAHGRILEALKLTCTYMEGTPVFSMLDEITKSARALNLGEEKDFVFLTDNVFLLTGMVGELNPTPNQMKARLLLEYVRGVLMVYAVEFADGPEKYIQAGVLHGQFDPSKFRGGEQIAG